MTKMPVSNKLTPKQKAYCQHLVDGLNQTDAYKAAGYSYENMKPDTVYQAASRLAANSKVMARIQELRDQITGRKAWSFARGMDEVENHRRNSRTDQKSKPVTSWPFRTVTVLLVRRYPWPATTTSTTPSGIPIRM